MGRGYAIVDVETTGFASNSTDRLIEVAVVSMTPDLEIDGVFETLVNPQRDVGPTSIHGITARDVFDAPTFDLVAPDLLEWLDGRLMVGHNVSFDTRFIKAELARAGYETPDVATLDTMRLAKSILAHNAPPSFRLQDVTTHLGFSLDEVLDEVGMRDRPAHSALGDALVTTKLLSRFVGLTGRTPYWSDHLDAASSIRWPRGARCDWAPKRRGHIATMPPPPPVSDAPAARQHGDYTALLKSSLADQVLSNEEIDELVATARKLGLDELTLGSIHDQHFERVVERVWADGILTDDERIEVLAVAEALGIDDDRLVDALSGPSMVNFEVPPIDAVPPLPPGSAIVLTGDMTRSRAEIEAEIRSLGFVPASGVSKKTALVIAADPYTQSGKAKKARVYGIPVLGEVDGLAMLRAAA